MPKNPTKKEPQKDTARRGIFYRKLSRKPESPGNENNVSVDGGTFAIVDMELPNVIDFLKQIDGIRTDIDKIEGLVQQIKQLHRSGKPIEPLPDPKIIQELDDKRSQVKTLSYEISTKLKKLEQVREIQDGSSNQTSAQWRIQESQIFVTTRRFRDIMNQYNHDYLEHREQCKKAIMHQLKITGMGRSDDELEEMLEQGNISVFTQGIMVETQQAKQSLDEIEARCRDIIKLEKGIQELHNMFVDLAVLVATQGAMIDSIEHNVLKAVDYVEDAATQVHTAVEYEKSARKKTICITVIVIAIVTILILLLVAYFTQGRNLWG